MEVFFKEARDLVMNNTEKQFIEILSKAIRNDRNIDYYEGVKWSNLINLAGEHKVEGIIYPLIAKIL